MSDELELTIYLDTEVRKEKEIIKKIERYFSMDSLQKAQNPVVLAVLGRRYEVNTFWVTKEVSSLGIMSRTETRPHIRIKGSVL